MKGLDIERCKQPDVGLPRPDVTLYFKISDEVFHERRAGRKELEIYDNLDFQKRVRQNLDALADSSDWKVRERRHAYIWYRIFPLALFPRLQLVTCTMGTYWLKFLARYV